MPEPEPRTREPESGPAQVRIGIPDLVSNSYFPIIAAAELGHLRAEGVNAEIELIFPVTSAAEALRDGAIDFLAGAAHAPLYGFPRWHGAKLVAALSHNMYWFLVARTDLEIERGDLNRLAGLSIGAAPGVGDGLAQLLARSGVDASAAGIRIAPVPGAGPGNTSFGVTAAEALAAGHIDAFWANGMGAEVAVRRGVGTVVLDARRDESPGRNLTFPALATTDQLIERSPELVRGTVRALGRAQRDLQMNPELATPIGEALFPPAEAQMIAEIIERDTPFYSTEIDAAAVAGVNDFARSIGLDPGEGRHRDVVAEQRVLTEGEE